MSKLENINDLYTNLIANNADFRAFVESMEKYSTDEIIAMYELEMIISYCSGPSKMPT